MSTTELSTMIEETIEAVLEQVHTALPGKLVSYNPSNSMATVQPGLFKQFISSPSPLPYPVISGVPVVQPRSNRGGLSYDLLPGDYGLIVFSERNIDNWALSGLEQVPADSGKFSLNDAFFIPGMFPQILPDTAQKPLTTSLWRSDGGVINMFNAVESFGKLMQDLISAVSVISTFGSPASHVGTPSWIAQMTAIQIRFANLNGVL